MNTKSKTPRSEYRDSKTEEKQGIASCTLDVMHLISATNEQRELNFFFKKSNTICSAGRVGPPFPRRR